MYPAKFEYYRAGSVDEAIGLLQQHSGAKVLAGGHSLIPSMKLRLAQPPVLVDIGRIAELSGVSRTDGKIRVGALTTHADLERSEVLQQGCGLLAYAAAQVGDRQVRHKGTIGGNLAHADPASDLPGVVLALDGVLHVAGPGGQRQIAASDFFVGLLMTALNVDEVLTAIDVPVLDDRTGWAYELLEHPASGYALCGAAALVTLADDGTCQRARLCYNGVTATPHDAAAVADALTGQTLEDTTIEQAVDDNLSLADPMGDVHASGSYRVELARVLGKRALKVARDRARS
jgi:carbon-monoxide dehydrogenase medium subunit